MDDGKINKYGGSFSGRLPATHATQFNLAYASTLIVHERKGLSKTQQLNNFRTSSLTQYTVQKLVQQNQYFERQQEEKWISNEEDDSLQSKNWKAVYCAYIRKLKKEITQSNPFFYER